MNILIVGSGAREHAIAKAFARSATPAALYCYGTQNNPGILELTTQFYIGNITLVHAITKKAVEWKIDLAIVGPEAPLEIGLVDALEELGILTVGPKKQLAQIETSKSFTRNLLKKYQISGCPRYQAFNDLIGVEQFLSELGDGHYVVKADGLMGGKGVKVAGDHLHSLQEAFQFCQELTSQNLSFVIEEKLVGQEFSLMCFTDGESIASMPIVQDHKRAFINDKGPNTGGMGSYSDANHSLPFLNSEDVLAAQTINKKVLEALKEECGTPFKGILYGGFIATQCGIYLIEYNARFGDPEALNVLSILDTDFVSLCHSLATGTLVAKSIKFKPLATVCKYAVPIGYPDKPLKNILIDTSELKNKDHVYYGAVDKKDDLLFATGSRTMATVGIAASLEEAEKIAEAVISRVKGELFHREDIGTKVLIDKRIKMMNDLRAGSPALDNGNHKSKGIDLERLESKKPIKIAILGSTRGSNLRPLNQLLIQKKIDVTISIVISNEPNAGILIRAAENQLPAIYVATDELTREQYDNLLSQKLQELNIDLVILMGYMKILSKPFIETWRNRVMNVHPSLLPAFAGKMDRAIHQAVLDSGLTETGCTVHQVDEKLDGGPILNQKKCIVYSNDTVDTLKARVQALEVEALGEAIEDFRKHYYV